MRDYSQSGEQALLRDLVGDEWHGRFLDIGAGDGETFSNTRCLALAGWNGVVVEPAAWAFDRLLALYSDTPAVRPVSAVITTGEVGLVPFACSRDDHLSSTDARHVARWKPVVPFVEMYAAATTLDNLLDVFGRFEVVSIDCEGISVELARAYTHRPEFEAVRVLIVERERDVLEPPGLKLVASTANNHVYAR